MTLRSRLCHKISDPAESLAVNEISEVAHVFAALLVLTFLRKMQIHTGRVNSVVKHVSIGAEGLGFEFLVGQIVHSVSRPQQLVTAATFLRSCVAQALSRGDKFGHSLLASA